MKKISSKIIILILMTSALLMLNLTALAAETEEPLLMSSVWLEETDADSIHSGFVTCKDGACSGGSEKYIVSTSNPNDEGYYAKYFINIPKTGKYAFYIRGSISNQWMSDMKLIIDGDIKIEPDVITDEGWVKLNAATSLTLGWSKATVFLTEGKHEAGIAFYDPRQASTDVWIGGFDCMVMLPANSQFSVTAYNIEKTKQDFELCAAVESINFSNIVSDIELPQEMAFGDKIIWTSSNPYVISDSGKVTRGDVPEDVILTAKTEKITKQFKATVKELIEFTAEADLTDGSKTINAKIRFTEKSGDKNVTAIIALYDKNERLKKCVSKQLAFTKENNSADITMTLQNPYSDGEVCRIFIWDGLDKVSPCCESIFLNSNAKPKKINDGISFHTELMQAYLNDSYDSAEKYVDGNARNLDKPLPIRFQWTWTSENDVPDKYILSVSGNKDMSNAEEIITENKYADVYNLKVGTKYYWTVSYSDTDNKTHTSEVSQFTTDTQAPRNLMVNGVQNIRDIGGWNTSDGKKVKQGLLFRSFRLSHYENQTFYTDIDKTGIDTMTNKLGIRSEIELRNFGEIPAEYTDSVLGKNIAYIRTPMNYDNDYLSGNKESIKNIFSKLADESNYPIVYHCAAGADRTAAVTYLINGLLGVNKEDLFRDYLITNFSYQGSYRSLSRITGLYVKTLDEYEHGKTLSEKIYNYLSEEVGIPTSDLDFIISYLKE